MIAIASRIGGLALIGATVVLASSSARAQSGASANPLIAQIEAALAPRVPDGMRLKSLTLGCQPPPDASIKEVARGLSRIRSSAFTVELTTPHGIVICSAQAEVERQALVAARDLSAGEEVGASEFRTDWVDAFSTPPDVLVSLDSVQTLMVPLRRGEPVSASLLRKPIVVHQGEMVAVTVTNGGVSLRTHLKASGDGAIGDYVTMENPTSGRLVSARVVGRGAASIELTQSQQAEDEKP